MERFTFVIQDALGIHARPAGALAKALRPFSCRASMAANGRTADARRVFDVMELGVKGGEPVTFTLEGTDEAAAAAALKRFCEETL